MIKIREVSSQLLLLAARAPAAISEHVISSRFAAKFHLNLPFFVLTEAGLAFANPDSAGCTVPFVYRRFKFGFRTSVGAMCFFEV